MRPAIRVDNLSKYYRIGTRGRGPASDLRETIVEKVKGLWGRLRGHGAARQAEEGEGDLWALKDVSFEVQPGEVFGIIGRNGAGKSTLLKILSQVVEPTSGRVEMRGRLGSLLEVGTGFHPELTGRENVYLNGSILGMSRKEIDRKFDEIVAFSEIERFLDTPVKRYSSGMYTRLAFAVAAHLEPEILIVDEVLAVGDTAFQEKCLGQMQRNATHGRTVLFVSHSMPSIRQLCRRVLLLKAGRVVADGPPNEVIKGYFEDFQNSQTGCLRDWADRDPGSTGQARILRLDVLCPDRKAIDSVEFGSALLMNMEVEFLEPVMHPTFGVLIGTMTGERMLDVRSVHDGMDIGEVEGKVRIQISIPNLGLYPGEYLLSPWVADRTMKRNMDWAKNVRVLYVVPADGLSRDLQTSGTWGKYWVRSWWNYKLGAPVTETNTANAEYPRFSSISRARGNHDS
jgi:lipopolysaccharide transport system ATP-binding protein